MTRHVSEYKLTLLPPSPSSDGMWYGYAQDCQRYYDNNQDCDPTPDNVKAHGYGADVVAEDLWHQLRDYVDTINKETT